MKVFFSAALVVLSAPVAGREARLESFLRDRPLDFRVLAPGGDPAGSSRQVERAPPRPRTPDAAVPDTSGGPIGQVPSLRLVPAWMRRGDAVVPSRNLDAEQLAFTSDCSAVGYFPRPDLSVMARVRRRLYFEQVLAAACAAGVPVRLFDALVAHESRYQPLARSPAGAMGLAQLMPATALYLGVSDPFEPGANLRAGARYLREQLDRYGTWELALAAYNAGPGNVDKHGGVPPFAETRRYVRTILASLGHGPTWPAGLARRNFERPFRTVGVLPLTTAPARVDDADRAARRPARAAGWISGLQ